MAQKEIPCYLFVGMLESGKTKFIQETMEDPQFDSGDKTLLLICEEGEEEYDSERFAFGGVTVATMDLIQSIIMTCALVVITCFGIYQAGGVDAVLDNVRDLPGYLSFVQTHDASSGTAAPYGMVTIVSTMAWGLGYFGMPHILVRFMAIRDENELKLSRRIASIWVVISMTVAICIGMIGYGVSKAGRIPMLEGSASETVIVKIADLLSSYGIIPAVIAGLILAGILAATMSTADSQLLSAASAFSENMLQDVFGVKLTAKQTMLVARLTVIVIAVIAAFLATDPNSSVFQIVSFAWAGFGATFGPAILFALFWRRSNRQGILAGLVAGGVMVFVWKFCVRPMGGAWNVYELLPAFIVASVVIVVAMAFMPLKAAKNAQFLPICLAVVGSSLITVAAYSFTFSEKRVTDDFNRRLEEYKRDYPEKYKSETVVVEELDKQQMKGNLFNKIFILASVFFFYIAYNALVSNFTATLGIPLTPPALKIDSFQCSPQVEPGAFTSDLLCRLRSLYTQ